MINRFIIDNYIIHLKSKFGLKIIGNKIYDKNFYEGLYKNLYNFINDKKLLQIINSLLDNFELDKYIKLNFLINKLEPLGNIEELLKNNQTLEISNIKTAKNIKNLIDSYNTNYKYLLMSNLNDKNFGYYIINIILINNILNEIDFLSL